MGFISSLLCCSSSQTVSQKEKPKKKLSPSPQQSRIHATLSNSTRQMNLAPSKSGPATVNKTKTAVSKKSGTNVAAAAASSSGHNENDDEDSDDDAMEVDEEMKKDDKQVVSVYNGETESSTGTAEEPAATAHKENEEESNEVTTVVHEADHSSSAEDSDAMAQDHSDLEVVPSYDYDPDEEVIDLTALQPDQAHAPGCSTLLGPKSPEFKGKKCLILDLDETLVHSSFKYLRTADFVIPVEIDDQVHNVYVIKRPGVDEFLKLVGRIYEVVVFTASVSRYGDPLLDVLDRHESIHHRLFRDSCYNYEGNYIKNLSQIGRPLSDLIILDNSPASYIFHPQHAVPISSWFSDIHDNELLDIMPLLEDLAQEKVPDVGKVLDVTI